MTLINCKECTAQISSRAKTCPHCGVKISNSFHWGYMVLGLALVTAIAQGVRQAPTTPEPEAATLPVDADDIYTTAPSSAPSISSPQKSTGVRRLAKARRS
jgi:RNA polymerase subunit RPABC4/transcription elongation factor Spt4